MISRLEERKEKQDLKIRDKADNAEVALGTSKINYNDREQHYGFFVMVCSHRFLCSPRDCGVVQEV